MKKKVLFILLVLCGVFGAPAFSEEAKPLIKIDIKETFDGKKEPYNIASYMLFKYFYSYGFDVLKMQKSRYDKNIKKQFKMKSFADYQKSLKKRKADFTITGKAVSKIAEKSTFYEGTVAFNYKAEIELTVKDKKGKVLAKIKDSVIMGASNQGKYPKWRAARRCLIKVSSFLCIPLYKTKGLKKHFKGDLKRLQRIFKLIEKERKKYHKPVKKPKKPVKKPKKPMKKPKTEGGGPF